ncbi:transposase [Candidatus Dojkabacteria bacterium]|nr:transposase [Candidatus Dojkabacteria bacterium]
MNRVKRDYKSGVIYHVYNRGNRKKRIFRSRIDRLFFISKLKRTVFDCGIELIGYCLMDNHFHLVVRQGFGDEISILMQRLLTSYSKYFNLKYRLVGHTFQGRYQAKSVFTKSSLRRLIRYIERNPVKEGYVYDPSFYKWLYINPRYIHFTKTLCQA